MTVDEERSTPGVGDPASTGEPRRQVTWLRRLRGRRMSPAGVAALLLVIVVLGELFVRWIEPNLPPARLGDEQELFVKVDQMSELAARGERTEVVFIGSSGVDAGIDPLLFSERSESFEGAYNAALVGMPTDHYGRWTSDVVLRHLDPELVVVGVNPQQLSARRGIEADRLDGLVTAFDASISAVDPDLLGQIDQALSERLALVRYRRQLRSPVAVLQAVGDRLGGEPNRLEGVNDRSAKPREFWEGQVGERGLISLYEVPPVEALLDPEGAQRMEDWVAGGPQTAQLRDLLRRLAPEVQVVVVVPPTDVETLARSGMDPTIWDSSLAELAALTDEEGVPLLDLTHVHYDPLDFHDKTHLSGPGRERFTSELASWVDQLCGKGELEGCPVLGD